VLLRLKLPSSLPKMTGVVKFIYGRVRADLKKLEEQGFRCVAIHSSYSESDNAKI
jgi:hypothetical protein